MAKTFQQVQKEIARLQEQAAAMKSQEVAGVVERIQEAVKFYGLTPKDIFPSATKSGAKPAGKEAKKPSRKVATAKRSIPIKYRDDAGNTWTGRGLKPRWLTAALAAGKSIDEFVVR